MSRSRKQYSPHWRPGMDMKRMRRRKRVVRSLLFVLLLVLIAVASVVVMALLPVGKKSQKGFAYILPNQTFEQTVEQLQKDSIVTSPKRLLWLASWVDVNKHLRPGRYAVNGGMNPIELVKQLIYGAQTPVKLSFSSVRTQPQLVSLLTRKLAMDSLALTHLLQDSIYCAKQGMDTATIRTLFIPDTYEVYWTISPKQLVEKMKAHYDAFWTPERRKKAAEEGLTPQQVSIIASIVEEESAKPDEYSRIAGLYINRLRKGIPLQADPTVKYAVGDFSLKRILKGHTAVASPYNTYRVLGLPPGPIRYPQRSTLEKVLNYEHHKYIYMCAKDDFSGYHTFATYYSEHLQNAYRYQKKLDERGIK